MSKGILGKKIGMTRIFNEEGQAVPVTVIEAGPCSVLQIKTSNKDGYNSIQIGCGRKKETKTNKPTLGHLKKTGAQPPAFIKELRISEDEEYQEGQEIKVDIFEPGEFVDIIGVSSGKGFQGGMKRWNWKGGPKTHGSMHHRRAGSIGTSASPSRVLKGKHMPGHMGSDIKTIQNIKVIKVDIANNLIMVKGSVTGKPNSYLMIKQALKKRKK